MHRACGSFEGLLEDFSADVLAVLKGCWRKSPTTRGSFEGLLEEQHGQARAVLKGCWRAFSMAIGSFEGLLEVIFIR
jgi:hypothetical protein